MVANSEPDSTSATAATIATQRQHCLDHARDLVAAAERLLADDHSYPNIAYHLAILAVEEIGKAGMLSARTVGKAAWDTAWIDKRLDDHVSKLMWAVWAPGLSGGKIDPNAFEEARQFAESTHARRIAGLYVDYAEDGTSAPPREAVRLEHATSFLNFAKAALELEQAKGTPVPGGNTEELEWFFATVSDALGQKRLFSTPFLQKHQELGGDTRAWVRWARDEFAKIAEDEKARLQRELARRPTESGKSRPKWVVKVRLQTPSHSLRPKVLKFWNDRIDAVKLRTGGPKNQDLVLEMTIGDRVRIDQVFDFGLSFSKLHIVMLNIGTCGFFWYELSGQAQAYYESITDLNAPHMTPVTGRLSGLPREWSQDLPDGRKRQRVALEEAHLNIAIMGLAAFAPLPNEEAEPIFGPYLAGLTFLSKTDLHLSLADQARGAFLTSLRHAMHRFGDLESEDAKLVPALHRVTETIIPDEGHRNQVFAALEAPGDTSVGLAMAAKRAADLYLALVARRLWPEFIKRAKEDTPGVSPAAPPAPPS
jgi:AbiV family abortive infection protein